MALSLVSAPATEPLTIAEAKSHLRVDVDDENDLVTALIQAAREWVETFTHRALITQTWDLMLDDFPTNWASTAVHRTSMTDGAIWLPKAPLQTVTSINYIDSTGTTTLWAATNYTVDAPAGPWARVGRIVPNYAVIYPVTRLVPNSVTARFVAGYGAAAAVPVGIKAAIKLLIGHWYQNREAVLVGTRAAAIDIPMGLEALLWPFKSF